MRVVALALASVALLAVALSSAVRVSAAELEAVTSSSASLHTRLRGLRTRHEQPLQRVRDQQQHRRRRTRKNVSIRVTATVTGYIGTAIAFVDVTCSDTQALTAAWLETQLLTAANFRTAVCGPNANGAAECASIFDRNAAFGGRTITHLRPNSKGSADIKKMVTQRTYTVGDNAVGLDAGHVLIVALGAAPGAITARAWAPGAVAVHNAAAIPCGVNAYLFRRDLFITACATALAKSHPLYGVAYTNLRYTYSVADLRTIGAAAAGALPAEGSAMAAPAVVALNQPVAVKLKAVIAVNPVTENVGILAAAAANFDAAFIAAVNLRATNPLTAALCAGGVARLTHNGAAQPTAYGAVGLNVAQSYVIEYFSAATFDALLLPAFDFTDAAAAGASPHHLRRGVGAENERHPQHPLLYINWKDPAWALTRAAPPPTQSYIGPSEKHSDNPKRDVRTALNAQMLAAAAPTPAALYTLLTNGAGAMPAAGAGYDENSPARVLKRTIEVAHGEVDNHFGYGYAVLDVAFAKAGTTVRRDVGFFCATANLDDPTGAHAGAPATEGVLVHTEQVCMEQLRQFVMGLEEPRAARSLRLAGGPAAVAAATAATNAAGVTTKVMGIRSRWAIDFVPDSLDMFRCQWMFQLYGVLIPAGHFREAPYTEAARQWIGTAGNPDVIDWAGANRAQLARAQAWILQEQAAGRYVALIGDAIAWTAPVITWTYTAFDPNHAVAVGGAPGAAAAFLSQVVRRRNTHQAAGAVAEAARIVARNAWNVLHPGQNVNNPHGTGNAAHVIARATPATAAVEIASADSRLNRFNSGRYGDGNPYHAGTQYPAAPLPGAADARSASVAGHAYPWFPAL